MNKTEYGPPPIIESPMRKMSITDLEHIPITVNDEVFYQVKEEKGGFLSPDNAPKRRRSKRSMSESDQSSPLPSKVMDLFNEIRESCFFDKWEDNNMKFETELKQNQRPQYSNDGSRGCIKSERKTPVTVIVVWEQEFSSSGALLIFLSDTSGKSAAHFELYIIDGYGYSKNCFEGKNGEKVILIQVELRSGENPISLEWIGIKRKDDPQKTNRLLKECTLTCEFYTIGGAEEKPALYSRIRSNKFICEQEIGPPVIVDMVPKESNSEGGGVLVVKGKNFIPGNTKVFFKGIDEYECRLAENMVSKDMVVCYIPPSELVRRDAAEVFVRIGAKQSVSMYFRYLPSRKFSSYSEQTTAHFGGHSTLSANLRPVIIRPSPGHANSNHDVLWTTCSPSFSTDELYNIYDFDWNPSFQEENSP